MNQSLLIIGKNGFIGSTLFKASLKQKFKVFSSDILPFSHDNSVDLILDAHAPDITPILTKHNIDIIINCSGAGNVNLSFESPMNDFSLNVSNLYRFLDQTRLSGCKPKFINISSAAVYGNPERLPITENMATNKFISPYGLHKSISEEIMKSFSKFFGIKTCSARAFSVYGKGLRKQLFWDIFQKLKKSQKNEVILSGTGQETRDFIHINDFVNSLLLVATSNNIPESVNIASGISTTIHEAAITILKFLEPNAKLTFDNNIRVGNPNYWQADISLLKNFGFIPQVNLSEGLRDYANWLKTQGN